MVKSAVQVCIRTRPTSNFAHDNLRIDPGDKVIAVHMNKKRESHAGVSTINNQQEDWTFRFNDVLHNASQEEVFDAAAVDILEGVIQGYNGTILAYGQTGAGKTFTMCGGAQSYKYRGLIPRSIHYLFNHINNHPENDYTVRVSYLEIYNEAFYDLLDETGGDISDLAVMDDDQGNVLVRGLSRPVANSEEEALNLLFEGETNRAVAQHQMNKHSSRSHCVFTLFVESRSRLESSEKVMTSKLNLVDLAGSERVKKTGSRGGILNEAKYINRSLAFLEQVVMALSNKHRDHIPYRQSKLTNVLRDSLGGNCKTRLIANMWGEAQHLEESISTLRFATRMMRVSTNATVNVVLDPQLLIKKQAKEIRELKQELAMHDTLANRGDIAYDPYTQEQQEEMNEIVRQYVAGDIEDIDIQSLRQVRELFKQFRVYARELIKNGGGGSGGGKAGNAAALQQQQQKAQQEQQQQQQRLQAQQNQAKRPRKQVNDSDEDDDGDYVGDAADEAGGFSIGQVDPDSRPVADDDDGAVGVASPNRRGATTPNSLGGGKRSATPQRANNENGAGSSNDSTGNSGNKNNLEPPPSEDEAFEVFTNTDGLELAETFKSNKKALKKRKKELKQATLRVNQAKKKIDELTQQIQTKRQQREIESGQEVKVDEDGNELEVIDEEEYALIRECKQQKKAYQEAFQAFKACKSETQYIKGLVEQSKVTMANRFLDWYHDKYGVGTATEQELEGDGTGDGSGLLGVSGSSSMSSAASTSSPSSSSSHSRRRKSASGRRLNNSNGNDELDDGEQFDRMEMERVMQEDPDSVSFFNARKAVVQSIKRKKARQQKLGDSADRRRRSRGRPQGFM
eukprot:TRINITY_DN65487_c10_g5_i2.p1 TRINITY_DN65487_c10_g5~~TRINITY_DN65487_c10_g5_i2.p1  ORF type:complete len:851 (+),score=535.62 TRINITY_DN65487_c10_g5_i2:178-2730(+)